LENQSVLRLRINEIMMDENIPFKGGIKIGTTAYDKHSKKLNNILKNIKNKLKSEYQNLECISQFDHNLKVKLLGKDCFGFAPDGGAWFKNGILRLVIEGKKQNKRGNAYERWFKNADIARYININVIYLTFCVGEGAAKGECLYKLGELAMRVYGIGTRKNENFKFHYSVNGFTKEEIEKVIRREIESISNETII
jgi:hypothetical protein